MRSVDRVYEEIITPEDLIAWANKRSQRFFAFSGEGDVIKTYKMMQQWVQTNTQFLPVADMTLQVQPMVGLRLMPRYTTELW